MYELLKGLEMSPERTVDGPELSVESTACDVWLLKGLDECQLHTKH